MNELNNYKIEHKILTLARCAVLKNKSAPASFEVDEIKFFHWDFDFMNGWRNDAWIAMAEISAKNFIDAINEFSRKLSRIIPRVALISQSYIEFIFEPFLIHKIGSDVAFLRYATDVRGGGLMFMERELAALNQLLSLKEIPDTFYYYWKDAINTAGYSSKLLIMFSAIEALVKKNGQKDRSLINEILGEDLAKDLFETKTGLRHRLVHGEYFDGADNSKNYLDLIHNKVISYFNKKILSKVLISENIVHPQRHFFGNKQFGNFLLKCKNENQSFGLKDILEDFNGGWAHNLKKYKQVSIANFNTTY